MSLQISYKKQILVLLMLLAVVLVVVEISLRTYDYFNPRCDFLKTPLAANVDPEFKQEVCDTWKRTLVYIDPVTGISQNIPNQHFSIANTNSHGFRGSEFLKEKSENTYRIFVVGGSTIIGMHAPSDQYTIAGYLQTNFDEMNLDKNIDVINAGIRGLTSSDELQLIKTKIVEFEPDMIIVYDGFNDMKSSTGEKRKSQDNGFTYLWRKYFSFYYTPYVLEGFFPKSNSATEEPFSDNNAERASVWKKNLINICELGSLNGFETLIILQPFLGTGNKIMTEQEKEFFEKTNGNKRLGIYHLFAEDFINLGSFCINTADFRNIFDDIEERVYFDESHVDSVHDKIIADEIFEIVRPLIR